MKLPNGLDADLSFESATGRLASIEHRAGVLSAPIAKFDHAYDVRGNLKTLTELSGQKRFDYDALERLTAVTNTASAAQVESYAFDAEGNRIASHLSPPYVTDDADRVQVFAHALTEKPLRTFSAHAATAPTHTNGAGMAI